MSRVWFVVWVWAAGLAAAVTSDWAYDGTTFTLAHLNITYNDLDNDKTVTIYQIGRYANGGVRAASGLLLLGRSSKSFSTKHIPFGCTVPWDLSIPEEPWVALVARGECADKVKIMNAMALNASAIIIYTRDTRAHLKQLGLKAFEDGGKGSLGVVFVDEEKGVQLERVVDEGKQVWIALTRGQPVKYHVTNINSEALEWSTLGRKFVMLNPVCGDERMYVIDCAIVTSVLFVSVSFIILMVISLAWLVFYYVQRFRYIHAKDRLARHLCNAAKKALAKIPVKNLKASDREVSSENECCAVCIEPYQVSEAVRTLPCKHEFHKNCVDPWLLEHRTCPMCKMDILKFYGYVFSGSTETVLPMDEIVFEIVLSESEESVLQLDMLEENQPRIDAEAPPATSTSPTPVSTTLPPLNSTITTTPTPPSAGNTHISQVVVVPREDSQDAECEDWPAAMVPNTPITPVHQPSTSPPPPRSTTPVLLSIASWHPTTTTTTPAPPPVASDTPCQLPSPPPRRRSSATTTHSPQNLLASVMSRGRKGSLQQVTPVSSAMSCQSSHHQRHSREKTPPLSASTNSDVRALESTAGEDPKHSSNTTTHFHTTPIEKGGGGLIGRDLELSSIYSEDFLDTESIGDQKEAMTIEIEETGGEKLGRTSGNSAPVSASSVTTTTTTTWPPCHSPSPSPTLQHHHSSSLCRSPLSPSKRKSSVSRSRSRSRKRSGSQVRSRSRGSSERKREHIKDTEDPVRPSSHVITVSHV